MFGDFMVPQAIPHEVDVFLSFLDVFQWNFLHVKGQYMFFNPNNALLLMEEILHHLGCIKPCK